MPSSSAQREPTVEYLTCVGREEELGRLRNQAKIRKSLLVFGPEGVGKSRLLLRTIRRKAGARALRRADAITARICSRVAPGIAFSRSQPKNSRKTHCSLHIRIEGHRKPGA